MNIIFNGTIQQQQQQKVITSGFFISFSIYQLTNQRYKIKHERNSCRKRIKKCIKEKSIKEDTKSSNIILIVCIPMVECTELQYKHNIKNKTQLAYIIKVEQWQKWIIKAKKRNNSVFYHCKILFPFLWVTEKKIKILTLFWNILYTYVYEYVKRAQWWY